MDEVRISDGPLHAFSFAENKARAVSLVNLKQLLPLAGD
jgi:hypothetical protein